MDEETVPAPRPKQDVPPLTDEGVAADDPMTPAQASYLHSLCEQTGDPFDDSLTAGAATDRIAELKAKLGRAHRRG